MIKKSLTGISCVLATALTLSAPVVSAEDSPHVFSGTVALTTDYLFRGISQTDREPAIQGSMDYTYTPYGFYAGVWASNVDEKFVSDGNIEMDFYGGFRGAFANNIGWDVGGIYYYYPGEDNATTPHYGEIKGGLSYTFSDVALTPALAGTVYYSPDFFGETGDAVYTDGSVGFSLPYGLGLGFHVGYQDVDDIGDYVDWKVGLSKPLAGFVFNVSYSDVSGDDEELFCPPPGFDDLCDGTVVFTVSRTF